MLFPFAAPSRVTGPVLAMLRAAAGDVAPFRFQLTEVGWFGDRVLWLGPDPAAVSAFRALTATIGAAFPAHQPYGGRFADVVPRGESWALRCSALDGGPHVRPLGGVHLYPRAAVAHRSGEVANQRRPGIAGSAPAADPSSSTPGVLSSIDMS